MSIRSNNKQHKEQTKKDRQEKTVDDKGGRDKPKPKPNKPKKPLPEHPTLNPFKTRQMNPDIREFVKKNEERQANIEKDMGQSKFTYTKYHPEVKEGFCVWHNSKYHTSQYCEILNALLYKHPNQPNMQPMCTSVAKHTSTIPNWNDHMEDIDLSELENATDDLMNVNNKLNINKNNVNEYFKISCNRVQVNQPASFEPLNQNTSTITFVADSGASLHMCNNPNVFTTYTEWSKDHAIKHVSLADDSKVPIKGIGSIDCSINGNKYTIKGVLFVSALSSSLYSVKQHCEKKNGQIIHFDHNMVIVAFPNFVQNLQIQDEITMNITITNHNHDSKNKDIKCDINHMPTYQINDKLKISYKPLSENATTPSKSIQGSAAFNIFASSDIRRIMPNDRQAIKADISMAILFGYYGRIAARSGLTMKHRIDIGAGVIDSDFRGGIRLVLINNGNKSFSISKNDKTAQIIIENCAGVTFEQLEKLTETIRGTKGLGCTDHPPSTCRVIPVMKNKPIKVTMKLPWTEKFS